MRLSEYLDDDKGDILTCQCGCGYGTRLQHWGTLLVADIHKAGRQALGVPVYATCGARCPRYNARRAKTERSQHAIAQALDLACPPGIEWERFCTVFEYAVDVVTEGQGGFGRYPSQRFVHIDPGLGEAPGRRWTE